MLVENRIDLDEIRKMSVFNSNTIRDAMKAIGNGTLGAAFIIDEHKKSFLNVVTDGDLRKALLKGHGLETKLGLFCDSKSIYASDEMLRDEINKLFDEKIRIIPVLDKNNKIVAVHYRDTRVRISVVDPLFDEKELENVTDCILSGWISSNGIYVKKFEHNMAKFCGSKYAVACSSGTSALHLALLALGIGKGDEVIVPTLSFIATANAVTYTGAVPIFVDSDPNTWNINPEKIKENITNSTKAIIPVHLYGQPADMEKINIIAKEKDLIVIEDAAEAHGAKFKGKRVGALGDAGVFSFYGNKLITTGEGGMIVTNSKKVYDQSILLRDHGMSTKKKYWHTALGYNYRMTNIQAAVGVAQLQKIHLIIEKKINIAHTYKNLMKDIPGIKFPLSIPEHENVFWLFTILIDESIFGVNSKKVIKVLKDKGIDSRPIFVPIHKQPIYKNLNKLPISEKLSKQGISLPSAPDLKFETIKYICNVIKDLYKN